MPQIPATSTLSAARVMSPEGPERPLLEAVSRALRGRGCDDLDRVPVLGRRGTLPAELRWPALAGDECAEAVPLDQVDRIDPAAVAAWVTGHYPDGPYPAVVLGSAHGGAGHLAAALGAPWLPTTFTCTVPWPGGSAGDWAGAREWGADLATRILRTDPELTVRQVHDPVRRGSLSGVTVTLHLRPNRLPRAYRDFLRDRVVPGGGALVLRDTRTWPVLELSARHSFQLGSPCSGLRLEDRARPPARYAELAGEPDLEHDLRNLAEELDRPVHRVLYPGPEALSASVADLYRDWLRAAGRPARDCVVETGRLIDPWLVLRSGLVPYWCESSARPAVEAAEWWLAGSSPFDTVTVLPEPPGTVCDSHAPAGQWRAVASFARNLPHLNRQALSRYPALPLPTSHASAVLRARHDETPPLPALAPADALSGLRQAGTRLGLLVG